MILIDKEESISEQDGDHQTTDEDQRKTCHEVSFQTNEFFDVPAIKSPNDGNQDDEHDDFLEECKNRIKRTEWDVRETLTDGESFPDKIDRSELNE